MREQLIDMLITGGYYRISSWREMVDLGHRYEIPVYPCISATRLRGRVAQSLDDEEPLWRAEAANILCEGGDGVYLFNHFVGRHTAVLGIGGMDGILAGPRIYAVNSGHVEKFLGKAKREELGCMPIPFTRSGDSGTAVVRVPVYEDPNDRAVSTIKLSVRVGGVVVGAAAPKVSTPGVVNARLNEACSQTLTISEAGSIRSYADVQNMPGNWWECRLKSGVLTCGCNTVSVVIPELSDPRAFELQDVHIELYP